VHQFTLRLETVRQVTLECGDSGWALGDLNLCCYSNPGKASVATRALALIGRPRQSPQTPDSLAGFLESCRAIQRGWQSDKAVEAMKDFLMTPE
jgi:hypothetical protein